MKHLVLSIIVTISLMGCASLGERPERVDGLDLAQQLELMIDDYVEQVVKQCIELRDKFEAGTSPVNCDYWPDLSVMHVSLPSIAYHDQHFTSIAQLEHNWCASAQAKTGKPVRWVRHFRLEEQRLDNLCFGGK